jgi:GTP cyclohydrolase I
MSATANSFFSPEDVIVLRGALDKWCLEKRVDIKSTEALFAATAALGLFQSGYNTSEKLLAALREHKGL